MCSEEKERKEGKKYTWIRKGSREVGKGMVENTSRKEGEKYIHMWEALGRVANAIMKMLLNRGIANLSMEVGKGGRKEEGKSRD